MGIGSAGTTAVDPSNPLYDAVKAGGGFVVDEETGEVTGGPDGDGTARTEQERLNQSNNAMGDDSDGSASTTDLIETAESAVDQTTDAAEQAQQSVDETAQNAQQGGSGGLLDDMPSPVVIAGAAIALAVLGGWV